MIDIKFCNSIPDFENKNHNLLVVFIDNSLNSTLHEYANLVDNNITKFIDNLLQNNNFHDYGSVRVLNYIHDSEIVHIMLVGIGKKEQLKEFLIEELGGIIFNYFDKLDFEISKILIYPPKDLLNFGELIASGVLLSSYKFLKYKSTNDSNKKLLCLIFTCDIDKSNKLFFEKNNLIEGVFLARNCINEPPNVLYPESYIEIIKKELCDLNVDIEILSEKEMKDLGMGAILGVGQGSAKESKLVIMKYTGDILRNMDQQISLVGKGVTFDSGGISLKPSNNMGDMKADMSGAAVIVGLIKSIALSSLKVNVIGIIGLVENMPDGFAQRPGDIVKSMNGDTIEILNTDAEGRLVLADAISYLQNFYNPNCIIDLATLTGAIVIALGNTYAGLYCNNDQLANNLINSGLLVNEKLWRMPLHEDYEKMLNSDIADIANISNVSGAASSSTAAHFIKHFIKKNIPWAHIDIAGVAWSKKNTNLFSKGAVGFGVRLLYQFIKDNYV